MFSGRWITVVGACLAVGHAYADPLSTFYVRTIASADDAEETSGGVVSLTQASLNIGTQAWLGMRFRSITIPQGATITRAFLYVDSTANNSATAGCTVYGEAADNSTTFSTTNFNVSGRSKTTASAAWTPISSWSNNTNYLSVDISAPLQEIVNRSGWASGNSLSLLLQSTSSGDRAYSAYDAAPGTAPLIWIEYTPYSRPASPDLLFVVTSTTAPTAQETKREEWLKWWAYRVTRIAATDTQANFTAAAALNDVAYISEAITSTDLNTKLTNSAIGIVTDEPAIIDDLGLTSSSGGTGTGPPSIASNAHYILSPFNVGSLALFSSPQPSLEAAGALSTESVVLATFSNSATGMIVHEAGGKLVDGTKAAGRRIALPMGAGADFNLLNASGQTFMRRTLEWAGALRAWWKLNETSGTTAADASTNASHGTITGTATWSTSGRLDGALTLNGSTYVQSSGLMDTPKNVTICGWANLSVADSAGAELISIGDCFAIRLDSTGTTQATFYNGSTSTACSSNTTYAGTGWRHFAAVFDDSSDTLKLYIDGILAQTLSTTSSIVYTGAGANTRIGRHGNTNTNYDFTGLIDDVRVYNYAMTANEVRTLKRTSQVRGIRVLKWEEGQ